MALIGSANRQMFYFDPDLGRMHDSQRVPSAGGSRRRRWEVKSKEAFETSLAVEIQSPQKRTQGFKKDFRKEPSTESQKDKSNVDNSYKEHPVASSPKVSSQKSKMGNIDDDNDPLSSRISALIDEANVKAKDLHKKSMKDKDKQQYIDKSELKMDLEREPNARDVHEMRPIKGKTKDDINKDQLEKQPHKEHDKAQTLNDKFETKSLKLADSPQLKKGTELSEYKASAPPLSPEQRETPKKKHKKKSESSLLLVSNTNEESYITLQLKEMDEDIIDMSEEDKECVLSAPNLLFASTSNPHGNINTVYQEKLNGFVLTKSEFSGAQKKSEDLHDVTEIPTRSSHAVFIQGGFRTFSVLCQGLLAGLTLAHCLLIFLLDNDPSKIPGLYPSSMAHVFFTLILFLTTVCLVAACDRCDIIGIGVLSGHGIKIPWTVAFYVSSMVMSLVAIRAENVLINIRILQSSTLSEEELTDLVDWWRWICVARSSLAVLAWLAVVPDPHTDALLDSIQEFHHN